MIKPVFIGASWCAPCKKTYPLFERVCSAEGLEWDYVDVESYDSRSSDVRSVPTIRVYDADGDMLAEHRGGATAEEISALLERGRALV
ncbi:thioredoxin family protein [Streptomyces sp. NBC_01244]|uniref:thioredoxin family protein n=1 Tax=Streptomyces sp. NBC_01244 TaxID=2903797 RepID=UPI003FA35BF5